VDLLTDTIKHSRWLSIITSVFESGKKIIQLIIASVSSLLRKYESGTIFLNEILAVTTVYKKFSRKMLIPRENKVFRIFL